jgi:hypothetical protein
MIDQVRETRDPVSTMLRAETPEGRRTLSCTLQTAGPDRTVYYAARDVTDETRMADELLDRATRDQLTRLATREVFHETVEACLATGMTVGVVMARVVVVVDHHGGAVVVGAGGAGGVVGTDVVGAGAVVAGADVEDGSADADEVVGAMRDVVVDDVGAGDDVVVDDVVGVGDDVVVDGVVGVGDDVVVDVAGGAVVVGVGSTISKAASVVSPRRTVGSSWGTASTITA